MSDLSIPSDVDMRDSEDSASGQDSVSVAVDVQDSLMGMDALFPNNSPLHNLLPTMVSFAPGWSMGRNNETSRPNQQRTWLSPPHVVFGGMPTATAMDQGSSQRQLMQGDLILFHNFEEL